MICPFCGRDHGEHYSSCPRHDGDESVDGLYPFADEAKVTCPYCGQIQPPTTTCRGCRKEIPACGNCGNCEACGYGQV